jgi:hypothetical protein
MPYLNIVLIGGFMKKLFFMLFVVFSTFCAIVLPSCKNGEKAPDPEIISKLVEEEISHELEEARADMGNGSPVLKLTDPSKKPWVYAGKVPFYSGASSFEREIIATYDGKKIVYYYEDSSDNKTTIEWSLNEQTDEGDRPKGMTLISLTYPSHISSKPVNFYHLKLSAKEVKFLEETYEMEDLGQNLYIYDFTYTSAKDIIVKSKEASENGQNVDAAALGYTYVMAANMEANLVDVLFTGFNVDALPEKLYPVNDRNAESRLESDMRTSRLFFGLLVTTTAAYIELSGLPEADRSRRIKRLNNRLSSGNKSLFNKVFAGFTKEFAIKGFIEGEIAK